jgi:hypothetical protein
VNDPDDFSRRDTEPGGFPYVPAEVVERFRRDSSHPEAIDAASVRRAMLSAALGPSERETCPLCGGLGEVSNDAARDARSHKSTLLPPPFESEPQTTFQEEPTRPER